jgi:WD40 repeat protein
VERGAELWRFEDKDGRYRVAFDRRGQRGLSITAKRSAKIWRADTGETIMELVGHVGEVDSAEWSADDTFIVTASLDRTARVWDPITGELLATFRQPQPLYSASLSPAGGHLLASGANGLALIWDVPRYRGSAAEFARLLRCRVPYEIGGERVVPRPRDLTACPRG